MFTTERPAENIHKLLDWLRNEHRSGFLYRGQIRDYPVMVPSFFRPLVLDLADSKPVVAIDSERYAETLKQSARHKVRSDMLAILVRTCGLGLGNIIAQQYGLSSETLDVTESIDVAAFFATRRYPKYEHFGEGGLGVIYRFRHVPRPAAPPPHLLSFLDDYFQRGRSDKGFFDFLVKRSEMEYVFARDRWWEYQAGLTDTVATLPFALSWSDLKAAIAADRERFRMHTAHPYETLQANLAEIDWRLTRFAAQHGGFVRPKYFWDALVPDNFVIARDQAEAAKARAGPGPYVGHFDLAEPYWPLVIPSAAIKSRLNGIENMRTHPECEAFFFSHCEDRKIGGFYRRNLWPEPSEDPLYAALWHLAIRRSFRHYPGDMPAIDDPEHGFLDRGYRVAGERPTRDARELDDLMRGQLEDAVEAIASGRDLDHHFSRHAAALSFLDRHVEAFRSIMTGLRINRKNTDLLIGLAEALGVKGKWRWSKMAVEEAYRTEPDNPSTLEAMGVKKIDSGDYDVAASFIARALQLSDGEAEHVRRRGYLTALRAVIAGVRGEKPLYEQLLDQLSRPNWIGPDDQWVRSSVERLLRSSSDTLAGPVE